MANGTSYGRRYPVLSVIVGIIFIIVGIWCICTPASTLAALTLLFIIGFFAAGVFDIILAFSTLKSPNWGWRLVTGIIDIILGVWLICMPAAAAAQVLIWVVGFYIMFYSGMGIAESFTLRKFGYRYWGWLLFFSIVGVLAAFFFLLSPVFGAIYISWLAGTAFISYGLFRCMI